MMNMEKLTEVVTKVNGVLNDFAWGPVMLLLLVGTVFGFSPALILDDLAKIGSGSSSIMIWVGIIFIYYIIRLF